MQPVRRGEGAWWPQFPSCPPLIMVTWKAGVGSPRTVSAGSRRRGGSDMTLPIPDHSDHSRFFLPSLPLYLALPPRTTPTLAFCLELPACPCLTHCCCYSPCPPSSACHPTWRLIPLTGRAALYAPDPIYFEQKGQEEEGGREEEKGGWEAGLGRGLASGPEKAACAPVVSS